ncbi:hypothetical protein [Geothermobacter hydrogeniphilus]|uniref:Uncharacterized protein n=1 Tax=Geothermobacter hydrogeniphilus TaxID=1969733 RepID=A0A1X0Y7X5_9BACT|nr:hypothetical protein [Geothermobacter hydrogeniphilus]ORJ61311.1 hypothetical protein B5V00_06680 [Geothermobacter hydrogeniphilus]
MAKAQKEGKKDYRQQRMERRVEMAKRDDVEVVPRRAAETNDFIRLLTANDFIVNRLRQQLGRRNGVPVEQAVQFLERNEVLRQEMNKLNAEMCVAMGMDYRPPRGFENPIKKEPELEVVEDKNTAKTAKG